MRAKVLCGIMAVCGLAVGPRNVLSETDMPAPIAHWTFDEAGALGRDVVGSHHGTVHGATPLYLDGDRKKTIPFSGQPRLLQAGRVLRIGDTGAGEFMDGVIDDVRIYSAALTDAQVADLARP